MSRLIPILVGGMTAVTAGTIFMSRTGVGLEQPYKEPISIREQSAHGHSSGSTHRRSYFVGGGYRGGK